MRTSLLLILLFFNSKSFGQNLSGAEKVDSFFNANMNSLKIYLKNKDTVLNAAQLTFVNLIAQLSGINPTIQYGIAVNSRQYKAWKKWIICNKNKIDWQFHIVEGTKLIQQGMPTDENEQEKYINRLKKLKID